MANVIVVGTPVAGSVTGATLTFSVTVPAGADGLFVGGGTNGQSISSATFNSVAMTEVWDQLDSGAVDGFGYLLIAPSIGTFNVVVTAAASTELWAGAVPLHNLEQSSIAAAHRTVAGATGGGGGAPSVSATSVSGDLVIASVGTLNATIAVAGGATSVLEVDDLGGNTFSLMISTLTASGTTTVMSATGGTFWGMGAMALIAAAGGATKVVAPSTMTLMGVQ